MHELATSMRRIWRRANNRRWRAGQLVVVHRQRGEQRIVHRLDQLMGIRYWCPRCGRTVLGSLVRFAGDARTPTGHWMVHGGANRLYGEHRLCNALLQEMLNDG